MQESDKISSFTVSPKNHAKRLVMLFAVWFALATLIYVLSYGYQDTMLFVMEVIGVCVGSSVIFLTAIAYKHVHKNDYFLFVAASLVIVIVLQIFNLAYGPYMYGEGYYYQRIDLAARFMLATTFISAPFVYNPTLLRRPVLMLYLSSIVFILMYVLFGARLLPLQVLGDESYKVLAEITQYVLAVLFSSAAAFHYAMRDKKELDGTFFVILACICWSIHSLTSGILMSTDHTRLLVNDTYPIIVFGFICLHAAMVEGMFSRPLVSIQNRVMTSNRAHLSLLNTLPDLIFKLDADGKILQCNHAMECFSLMDDVPLVGRNIKTIRPRQIGQHILAVVEEALAEGTDKDEYITYQDDTAYRCLKLRVMQDNDSDINKGKSVLCSMVNVTPMNGREHNLISSHYDDLTELYNLQGLQHAVKNMKERRMFILVGNIDGLKPINDTFGRHTGDQMIKVVAQEMKKHLMPNWALGRTSGDEFTVVMPNASLSQLEYYKQVVVHSLQERPVGEGKIKPLVTFGSSVQSEGVLGFEDGRQQAKADVYKNKINSRVTSTGSLIRGISQMLHEHGSETLEHCQRVANILKMMARQMDIRELDIQLLELLAFTHDIGKITIPRHILNKRASLTDHEWQLIRSHPEAGSRIAASSSELVPVANLIIHHHENWDGSGYPRGVKGRSIPLLSRMLQVADAYDVMTHDQCYKEALSREQAKEEIRRNVGRQFDPHSSEILLQVLQDNPAI